MPPLYIGLFRIAALALLVTRPAVAQTRPAFSEEFGYLEVRRDHIAWPTPESLVIQLRSRDDEVRLKALSLLGLTTEQAHRTMFKQSSPTRVIGDKVVTPDQILLTYAALGSDASKQAIIAIEDYEGQLSFAAVGVATRTGWKRVAAFDCWCKYEMYLGRNPLDRFVQLLPAPQADPGPAQRYELVLRASGGGTGIYTQYEAHFSLFRGKLRRILAFVSKARSCPAGPNECAAEERRFYPVMPSLGGVLVERRERYPAAKGRIAEALEHDLGDGGLANAACRLYKWDPQEFRYVPSGEAKSCEKLSQ